MSFILDALKKSQQERDAAIDDEFQGEGGEGGAAVSRGKRRIILAFVGIFIAAGGVLAGWYFELFPPFSRPEGGETAVAMVAEAVPKDTTAGSDPRPGEAETATPTATAESPEEEEKEAEPAPVPAKTKEPAPTEEPSVPAPPEELPVAAVAPPPPRPQPMQLPVPPRKPPVIRAITPPTPIPEKPSVAPVVEATAQSVPEKPSPPAIPEAVPEKPSAAPIVQPVPEKPPPPEAAAVRIFKPAPPPAPKVTERKPEPVIAPPPKPPATAKRITVPPPSKRQQARGFLERARGYEEDGLLDQAVEAYSQALERDPDLTAAYLGRGWSYLEKGQAGNAVGDFTQAIERRPREAEAYFARAWAHERMGAIDQALADYGQVVRLQPDNVAARFGRGVMHFYRRRFDLAAGDFTDVLGRGGGDLDRYSLLWRYLSRVRAGATGVDELMAGVGKVDLLEWPGVIVALFLGQVGPERVLSSARDADPQRQREKQCVAYFFLGQLSLAYGDDDDAAAHFRRAVDTGVTGLRQYWAARQELRRLGAD